MTLYLDLDDLLAVAAAACEGRPEVRDHGLLLSALARPQGTVFGADAYPGIYDKAAALLHSLCANHALVDGNKRLAIGATIVFLDINDAFRGQSVDDLFDLTMSVADGSLTDIGKIAERLARL